MMSAHFPGLHANVGDTIYMTTGISEGTSASSVVQIPRSTPDQPLLLEAELIYAIIKTFLVHS